MHWGLERLKKYPSKKFQVYKNTIEMFEEQRKRYTIAEGEIEKLEPRIVEVKKLIKEIRKKKEYPKELELELCELNHNKARQIRQMKWSRESMDEFLNGTKSKEDVENFEEMNSEPDHPEETRKWNVWCTRCGCEEMEHYYDGGRAKCNRCQDCFAFSKSKKLPYSKINCEHERLKVYARKRAFCENNNCLKEFTDTDRGKKLIQEELKRFKPYKLKNNDILHWVKVFQKGNDVIIDLVQKSI